ncbi:CCR4-Not complex component, Not1-domain-containing protein [Mycotypha africana]|uniref:CCR4-Not complex component, Not1-domain-containing protein n=1 Tax=Mycotypha africana TaxID=64632 RepID=UPI0022FFD219|nr:CCR4-Not complex component, Not1-domain-containing protein [Mycotypha africana]KAI8975394.1 CCR4-Not complex component, Not1-domain-containing protein [Mycotypha africana]
MHVKGQLSVLYHLVYAPSELLDMSQTATRKIISEELVNTVPNTMRTAAAHLASQQLNCLDLLESVMNLAGTAASEDVRVFMDRLAIQAPELLLIGLAQIQPIKNELHRSLLPKLLNIFLIGHVNSPLVIRLLWHVQPNLLLEGFFEMYKKDPTSVSRVLDLAQEAKIVVDILKADMPFFTLDLASLAARRQNLNLEKWLLEKLAKDGFAFFGVCIGFLERKCAIEMARQSGANVIPTLQLSFDVIRIFFRILSERPLPPAETAKLSKLSQLYAQLFPQLHENQPTPTQQHQHIQQQQTVDKRSVENAGASAVGTFKEPLSVPTSATNENERNYPEEVEEMVRLYFERLYTQDISPSRFASVLKACRTSNDQRQVNFFSCTTHTLLDESRFFSQYPDNELMATGELLGLLVDQHLVSYAQLRSTLKIVLDALKCPVSSKMFKFGIQALTQFRGRLSEWPQYTLLLSKIEGLRGYPTIVESIALTLKQLAQKDPEGKIKELTASNSSSTATSSSSPKTNASVALTDNNKTLAAMTADSGKSTAERSADAAINVTTLLKKSSERQSYEMPPEKVQERVAFLINNLSVSNMESKVNELKQLLQKPTFGWFSHYLVVRRVSIESNNHELYSALLDRLDLQPLIDAVIEETFSNISLLLQSEGTAQSSSDRNLLKNLGSWLGRLTIGKNKPIRHKDMSFKNLLVSSYSKQQLMVAVPFVCKVLQHAADSKIFKPPNPWLMSSLKVLAELYWTEGLKLNLKFEIEILFKTLNVDLNEIEPTSVLNKENIVPPRINYARESKQQQAPAANSPTTYSKPVLPAKEEVAEEAQTPRPPPVKNIAPINPPNPQEFRQSIDVTPMLAKLQINPAIAQLMIQYPIIKNTVYAGVSEAFLEVVPPIILTSANVAAVSTKEMVLKDFQTEPDESRLQRAAHAMVQPLACSLSVVSCKEPLCSGIISVIITHLTQQGLPEQLADEIATTIADENIELLCLFIDQLTKIKALEDVDRGLAAAYASRLAFRKQQQHLQHQGERFFDVLSLTGAPHSIRLPEPLRPTNGVSPEQFRVYESFDQKLFLAMQQQPQQQQQLQHQLPQQIQQQLPLGNSNSNYYSPELSLMGQPRQLAQPQHHLSYQPPPPPPPFMNSPNNMPATQNNNTLLNAKLEQMLLELDRLIRHCGITNISQLPPNHDICLLIRQIPLIVSQSATLLQTMIIFVEKVMLMFYQNTSPFALEVYATFLQSLFEISSEVTKETLSWLIYADDERKYNSQAIAMLIRYELLPLEEYDIQLAKLINEKADSVIEFAAELMRLCLLSLPRPISYLEDHILTLSALHKLVKNKEAPTNVLSLFDDLRASVEQPYKTLISKEQEKDSVGRAAPDCLQYRMLLAEWVRLCQHPMAAGDIFNAVAQKAIYMTKESDDRCFFFRFCTEVCVNHYLTFRSVSTVHHRRMIHLIDSFSKLITAMIMVKEDEGKIIKQDEEEDGGKAKKQKKSKKENTKVKKDDSNVNNMAKIKMLNDALSVIILVLSQQHEKRGVEFNQKPFLRLFSSIFNEISKLNDKSLDACALITFSDALYTLQPCNFPGFAFSWLQLISCRSFLPQLLATNDHYGSLLCQKLIHALLKFLGPLLGSSEVPHATKIFYRGTLRVLVLLLHDFPEFLCHNYMLFTQAIPHSCVQLRNLILSAFPRIMHLPDPFTPDLKLETLPESSEEPIFDQSYVDVLEEGSSSDDFKSCIDQFMASNDKNAAEAFNAVLDEQYNKLQKLQLENEGNSDTEECYTKYNTMLSAFVLYIGAHSAQLKDEPIESRPAMLAYKHLLSILSSEGRYVLLSTMADNLRYPNSHTCFFNAALLYLFSTQSEIVKEQITRVLLERLIVNRPHPWGLLATFIELIKDPKFWDHEFIRCSPDIERLFDNVSR